MPDATPTGSPIPPQLLAALSQRTGAVPMPGAAPSAMPGTPAANPAAALAQRDMGGINPQQKDMMIFLAGMGFPVFMSTLEKAKPKPPTHHKQTGMGADAQRAPGQAIPPQLAAMLAQRMGQLPQGAANAVPAMAPAMIPGGVR